MQLTEKYRPRQWSDVIGQDETIQKLATIRRATGLAGKAYWISGPSGVGKTTIGRLIAAEVADPYGVTEFADPTEVTASVIESIRKDIQLKPYGKGFCYILNEAHGCSDALVRKLLGLTESGKDWITWVFTTTVEGQQSLFDGIDTRPLLGRCIKLRLNQRGLCEPFAHYLRNLAMAEGLDGQDISRYVRLMKDNNNSLRAGINAVESGEMLA